MVIQTNISALFSYRESSKTARAMKKNLEKLSSGYRINRSSDDASGLAVSERMRANITELYRCHSNAKEGVALAKTADGALAEVNDMLRRARELCIQAENGTYSQQELASISDEMNQLFSEVDRITEGSFFNEIQLFRGDVGPDFHYEYDEVYGPPGASGIEAWGDLDFVKTEDFDEAEDATAATVTLKLDDSIDFDDVNSLDGRSIKIGQYTYRFSSNTSNSGYVGNNTYMIPLNNKTTEAALGYLYNYSTYVQSYTIDKNNRTMTLTAPLRTLEETIEADGKTVTSSVPSGNGAYANGIKVENLEKISIGQVDGSGATNNVPSYSSTITGTYNLSHVHETLTQADVDNLKGNTLHITGGNLSFALKDISGLTAGMKRADLGKALAAGITKGNCKASYDESTSKLTIQVENQSTVSRSTVEIYESTTAANKNFGSDIKGTALGLSVKVTQPASMEKNEICEITIPSSPSVPFSFSLGGYHYIYADKTGFSGYDTVPSYGTWVNTAGMTPDSIKNHVINAITNYASSYGTVTKNGDTLTVSAKNINHSMNLTSNIRGTEVTGKPYNTSGGTSNVLGASGTGVGVGSNHNAKPFEQDVTVSFSLGSSLDVDKLAGSGFSITNDGVTKKWEFTKGGGLSGEYADLNIAGCTLDTLAQTIQNQMGAGYTAVVDDSGDPKQLKITFSRDTENSSYNTVAISDGAAGLISGGPLTFSGGANTGHSQKKIDFSSVNSGNLNDLLGKGFRINCATCSGEYINVFFCWKDDGKMPPAFDIVDPATNETRTIHNISVELSKVTNGNQIVQSIVEQVRPSLKHYTDVAVGSPPTTLIALEKRLGDVRENGDPNGKLYLGKVQTGLQTNFTYTVNIRKVEDYPEDGSVALKNAEVEIYVGSEPDPQIIPIHLPYLDLKTLRLRPPETVDLNAADQNASGWLNRVDQANLAISKARGVIGADYNRLEYTLQSLSHSKENLVDAESRIRDTDMAEGLMEHIKHQILTQSQQSMLSQALAQPQQVLSLIS